MSKAALIINPACGRKKSRHIEKIIHHLELDFELITVFTLRKSAAAELTQEFLKENVDLIIVGGGDGTINEVINVLVGTSTPLGIIPLGTIGS